MYASVDIFCIYISRLIDYLATVPVVNNTTLDAVHACIWECMKVNKHSVLTSL